MITAQVVLINKDGLTLGVSRKDDHNQFGLPGGKMDLEDNMDPMKTAIRECKEETGLDISNLRLIFAIHKSGNMGYTYLADYSGEIGYDEPHVVNWVPFQILINGPFGRYNQLVSESLTDMGIVYKIIDEEKIKYEVIEYINTHTFNNMGTSLDYLVRRKDWFGKISYDVYLKDIEEESCNFDQRFSEGLDAIGEKHGAILSIPSHYYSK